MYNSDVISMDDLYYYRQRHRNRVFSAVVSLFSKLVETKGLTKRELALRLGKEPAQITRWFSGPSNWTLDTVSDLLLAMGGELDHKTSPIDGQAAACRDELAEDVDATVDAARDAVKLSSVTVPALPIGPLTPELLAEAKRLCEAAGLVFVERAQQCPVMSTTANNFSRCTLEAGHKGEHFIQSENRSTR